MSGAVQPAFRIDVAINDLLLHSAIHPSSPPEPKGLTLPEPVFPQHPELLSVPGPATSPENRHWTGEQLMRKVRGWLVPYIRSRVLPGEFSSDYCLPVCRVQMQYRLLVLLVVQQPGERNDGRYRTAVDRLAA